MQQIDEHRVPNQRFSFFSQALLKYLPYPYRTLNQAFAALHGSLQWLIRKLQ